MKMKKIDIREVEGFRLGTAEDAEAGTGVTVIISEEGAVGGCSVRGGAPATRETDLLRAENTVDKINAVFLSGGSAFGLEAGSGIMRALAERQIGFNTGEGIYVPIVPGASLYDLAIGRSDAFPDVEMGRQVTANAFDGIFESGNHGAGTGATVGKYMGVDRSMKSGLGTFACGDDFVQVGAITAVNAVGDIYNGAGNIIAGLRTSDGSSIKGTIRVLKGMVHEGSASDLDMSDVKTMAVAEALQRIGSSGIQETPDRREESESVSADDKDDIVRAMMKSYELEQSGPSPETAAEAQPEAEMPVQEEPVYPAPEPAEESVYASPEPAGVSVPAEDTQAVEDEYISIEEGQGELSAGSVPEAQPEAEVPVQEESAYSEHETEPEVSAAADQEHSEPVRTPEDDEYVLTEEDKADMGYDIAFNTTISCLITNAVMTKAQANKLADILHDAYARAIKPVHGTMDGDTIFVMSTCTQKVNFDAFAALATDVLQYAIIDAAHSAEGAYGLPAAKDIIHK